MNSFVLNLALGGGLVIAGCFVLRRFLGRLWGAFAAFLLVSSGYFLLAAWNWPGADVATIHIAIFASIALTYSLLAAPTAAGAAGRPVWALWFIGALFVVVVAVNVTMVLLAEHGMPSGIVKVFLPDVTDETTVSSKFPGTVTPGAQKRELLYANHLQKLEQQSARGWQVEKGWVGRPEVGKEAVFRVRVQDARGTPLQGARLEGSFLRPSDRQADHSFTMSEIREGLYQTTVSLPLAGSWQLLLRIDWGGEQHEVRGTTAVHRVSTDS